MSGSSKDSKRRRHPRTPFSLLVQYRFDALEDFLSEYATDISLGGMFIRTDEPYAEGSLVYLQFHLRNGSALIEGLGKVAWNNPPDEKKKNTHPAGMGIEFIDMDEKSMQLIRRIVNQDLENEP